MRTRASCTACLYSPSYCIIHGIALFLFLCLSALLFFLFSSYKLYQCYRSRKCNKDDADTPPPASLHLPTKPRVVFVLGGPGAGKGTQCEYIVGDFGFVHLSAGDLLRDEQQKGGETGEMIKKLIAEGKIVPVAVTLGLLRNAIQANMEKGNFKFLVDGFPRNADNLLGWKAAMTDFCQVEFCLFLDCPEKVMESRLLKRGETSGRADDNAESIKKRFKTYEQQTKPVIDEFAAQGKLRKVVADKSKEAVREQIKDIFLQVQW